MYLQSPGGVWSAASFPCVIATQTQLDSSGGTKDANNTRSGTWTHPWPSHRHRSTTGTSNAQGNKIHSHGKRVTYTDVCEKPNALIHLSRTTVQIISLDTLILIHNLQCYGPYTNYCCSQQQMNINITVPSIIARGSN